MKTKIITGPTFVTEALFGIGLSFGLTSDLDCVFPFYGSPEHEQLIGVSKRLAHKQGGHNKFLETICLTLDVLAPRYWWQEFDTYRAGVTKQSESTIHTIMSREICAGDFEGEIWADFLTELNAIRLDYLDASTDEMKQSCFEDMKSALPEGYLQRRIVCLNVKALQNIYNQRKNHKLRQWHIFFDDIRKGLTEAPVNGDLVSFYIFGGEHADANTPA